MFIVEVDIAKRSHMVRVIGSEGRTVCKPFLYPQQLLRLQRTAGAAAEAHNSKE